MCKTIANCSRFSMEAEDDFYIYLNSSNNKSEFKNNSNVNFTNIIQPNIKLDGDYVVGLQDIIFNPVFHAAKLGDQEYKIVTYFRFYDKSNERAGHASMDYTPTYDIEANNISEFIKKIDRDYVNALKIHKIIDNRDALEMFSYDSNNKLVNFKRMDVTEDFVKNYVKTDFENYDKERTLIGFKFAPKLVDSLGLSNTLFYYDPEFANPPKMLDKPNSLYIYSNIVTNSYVGSQKLNLLDIFPLPGTLAKNKNDRMYKKVANQILDSVNISIKDENGIIPKLADFVIMTIVLHFKRCV